MPDATPDQAAQEMNKLLDKFDLFDISHNDFVRLKPQVKAALFALMYRANLAVIGSDDEYSLTDEVKFTRNRLRAEQRQAAAQRYSQEGGNDE